MVNEEWFRTHFEVDDQNVVYIPISEYTTIGVSLTSLTQWFGNLQPSYDVLSQTSQAQEGWQPIFDKWKSEGLI